MNGQLIHLGRPRPGHLARRFLRFAWSKGPAAIPTGRQVAADATLAGAIALASFAVVVLIASITATAAPSAVPGPAISEEVWKHGALLAAAARGAPLAMRRLRPLTAFWLCLAACLLLTGLPGMALASLIALAPAAYSAVAYSRYRGAALLSAPAAVLVLAVAPAAMEPLPGNYLLLTAALVIAPAVAAGDAMRLWRRRAGESAARLARLEAEQQDAARRAVALERSRIARELHDVVTHNVSMMVIQVGAARRVLTASPAQARSALLAVEEGGRAAITELQHLLGLLAPQEDGGLTGGAPSRPLQPQPGLDRLRPLISRVAAAGLPVELKVSGAPRALPQGMDLAAYRVIQEALTNVIKHAGRPRTTVMIRYAADALTIEVVDEGDPGAAGRHPAHPGSAGITPGGPAAAPRTGRGLLGLRERVSLYGGELDAGRRPSGGWRVRARIPDEPALAAHPAPS